MAALVKQGLSKHSEKTHCMNRFKIKSYRTNNPLEDVSENDFPVVFSEEAFIRWSDADFLVVALLLGDQLVTIHQGGYQKSETEKGAPGSAYMPHSYEDAAKIFEDMKKRGAVVELTPAGRGAHAWQDGDFCVEGNWQLDAVTKWTEPATDSSGRIVTHITAKLRFYSVRIGDKALKNPFGAGLTETKELANRDQI